MDKFIAVTNRGAQIAIGSKAECEAAADNINARNSDVFAWVVPAPAGAKEEDMPGRGLIYG